MFGFLTFGTTLALTDLAVKKEIEARPDEEFPKTVKESGRSDPPLQKSQSGLFLRIHEGIPETCGDGPGLHAVGGSPVHGRM